MHPSKAGLYQRTNRPSFIMVAELVALAEHQVKAASAPFNAHLIDLMLNINEATRSAGRTHVYLRVHGEYRET